MKRVILALAVLLCCTAISCRKNNVLAEEGMHKSGQVAGPDGLLKPCYCPAVYKPVCGSNGVTYSNACEARCNGITVYTPGACGGGDTEGGVVGGYDDCRGKPQYNVYCLDVYQPVCGCDGNTYSNGCYASVAGIKRYTPGPCGGGDNTMKPAKQ